MKILQVNKFFYPRAGTETYMFGLAERLRDRGHEVAFFSMKDSRNRPCSEDSFFVDPIDYFDSGRWNKVRFGAKVIYSREAEKKLDRLLEAAKPDIVHLHNFHHQLSPSILRPIRKRGIPTVMTVHDLKIVCPNYLMLAGDGVCERCKRHRYYHCFLQACVKGSRLGSLVNTIEMTVHWLLRSHRVIDRFLTPSAFYRNKLVEWGIPAEKVLHVPNPVDAEQYVPAHGPGDYILFAGRIAEEKGIFTLLRALKEAPMVPCRIAGTGPEEGAAHRLARDLDLKNAEFLGFVPQPQLMHVMGASRALVLPSEWYENGPMAGLESLALARPVVASTIGGIPEMVHAGVTGLLFPPGDAAELASCLRRVMEDPDEARRMGAAGRNLVETSYTPGQNTERVLAVYEELKGRNKNAS